MDELAGTYPGALVRPDADLEREFEERLAESSRLAFRVAFGVLRHREDAEDVAQEALARAHGSFRKLRERDRFRSWLVRVAWRLALDRRRSDQRRQRREQAAADGAASPSVEDVAAGRELQERLWSAIDELPEKLRLVLVLAAIDGMDVRECGVLLGVPDGTVKSRLHSARRKLAEKLRWNASGTTRR
jgi:RNA polymerase sigma-70 factor (ECF subfamily)